VRKGKPCFIEDYFNTAAAAIKVGFNTLNTSKRKAIKKAGRKTLRNVRAVNISNIQLKLSCNLSQPLDILT
jgi:hypothetical protein